MPHLFIVEQEPGDSAADAVHEEVTSLNAFRNRSHNLGKPLRGDWSRVGDWDVDSLCSAHHFFGAD